jgi:glycerophosphoryl diester phosphodiesterase
LPVIMHDRATPKKRAVVELTRREIESDVGHPVPVLDEVLDAFADLLWNIEIKNPEVLPAAMQVLKQFQRRRRLLVTSFRHDVVTQCAGELEADCGLLLAHRPLDIGAIIVGCAAWPRIKAIVWDYNVVDETVLCTVAANSWGNYVYGAATHAEHKHCAGLGLAGLITDHPAVLRGA